MEKLINGISYHTECATMIVQSESLTSLSGRSLFKIFRTWEGHWFQTMEPAYEYARRKQMPTPLDPQSVRHRLEKVDLNRIFSIIEIKDSCINLDFTNIKDFKLYL
ncbi:MAG: hypothetical protein ABIJ59_12175 [Pseudomonadota bacterium]